MNSLQGNYDLLDWSAARPNRSLHSRSHPKSVLSVLLFICLYIENLTTPFSHVHPALGDHRGEVHLRD
jgi:hypothetical protein